MSATEMKQSIPVPPPPLRVVSVEHFQKEIPVSFGALDIHLRKTLMSNKMRTYHLELKFTRASDRKVYMSVKNTSDLQKLPVLEGNASSIAEWLGNAICIVPLKAQCVVVFRHEGGALGAMQKPVLVLVLRELEDSRTPAEARVGKLEAELSASNAEHEKMRDVISAGDKVIGKQRAALDYLHKLNYAFSTHVRESMRIIDNMRASETKSQLIAVERQLRIDITNANISANPDTVAAHGSYTRSTQSPHAHIDPASSHPASRGPRQSPEAEPTSKRARSDNGR
jgi:hypothetical protein